MMAPTARNTATCGVPLRSISPESSADTMITAPISASVAKNAPGLKITGIPILSTSEWWFLQNTEVARPSLYEKP